MNGCHRFFQTGAEVNSRYTQLSLWSRVRHGPGAHSDRPAEDDSRRMTSCKLLSSLPFSWVFSASRPPARSRKKLLLCRRSSPSRNSTSSDLCGWPGHSLGHPTIFPSVSKPLALSRSGRPARSSTRPPRQGKTERIGRPPTSLQVQRAATSESLFAVRNHAAPRGAAHGAVDPPRGRNARAEIPGKTPEKGASIVANMPQMRAIVHVSWPLKIALGSPLSRRRGMR